MATNFDTSVKMKQRKPGKRALLLLPPLALVLSGLVLLVASPLSWDAAAIIDAPSWMPPVLGVLVALGGLWIGGFALSRTLTATRGDFEVFGLQTVFGALMFLSGSAMMLSLVVRLPDEATYRSALDDDGQVAISALGYFAVSIVLGAFQVAWVWVGAYLYSHAVTNQEPNRISASHPD